MHFLERMDRVIVKLLVPVWKTGDRPAFTSLPASAKFAQ
jgi:hypothetical protein